MKQLSIPSPSARLAGDKRMHHLPGNWSGAVLSFVLPFLTYLATLAPTVYGLDSAELTTAAYSLGLVHPPGYPVYLLIGKLFTLLPFRNVGYRMNLMSAFFGALAILFLYQLLLKLTGRTALSLGSSLLLAFSYFLWTASVMAEVYTLHLFLMAALVLVALEWQEKRDDKWLHVLALLFGLSLGNHLSTLLLGPGLLYWLLASDRRHLLRPRRVLTMLAFLALGLSVYLYLPLRYAAGTPAVGAMPIRVASLGDVAWVVSARTFWVLLFAYRGPELWGQVVDYGYCLWGNFLGVGLVIGVVGIWSSLRRLRTLSVALGWMYLANAIFFITYGAGDKRIMFLPTYFVWAIWIGLGYNWLLEQVSRATGSMAAARRWRTAVHVLLVMLILLALVINYRHADLSQDWRTYQQAVRVFDTVAPDAYVLATSWFEVAPLEYLHVVERRRLDVTVLNAGPMSPSELRALVELQGDAHPIYSTGLPDWLEDGHEMEYNEQCDCYRIQ
jgi:hypothetical protein